MYIKPNIKYCCYLLSLVIIPLVSFSQKPDPPEMEYLSVDHSYTSKAGDVYIKWKLSPSANVVGYTIYKKVGGIWKALKDTIWNPLMDFHTDTGSLAATQPETYTVEAFDSSMNISTSLFDNHTTIYASLSATVCPPRVKLTWTPYQGWDTISGYTIYCDTNKKNAFYKVETVSADSTNYTHDIDPRMQNYAYYIEAENPQGFKSASNLVQYATVPPDYPLYINADYTVAEGVNRVRLSFTIDSNDVLTGVKLLRSTDTTGFNTVYTDSAFSGFHFQYTDFALIHYQQYFYKLTGAHSCGNDIYVSNTASTIFTKGKVQDKTHHRITWTPYLNWRGGVQEYNIYRTVDDNEAVLLTTLSNTETSYSDDISSFYQQEIKGKFCYYIEAVEGNSNPYGIKGTSRSNTYCIYRDPVVYIPSVINPSSNIPGNKIFLPVISFASPDEYSLYVFNRWGEQIFKTNKLSEGWDAKINGSTVPEGVYIYKIQFTTSHGMPFEKRGQFMVSFPD